MSSSEEQDENLAAIKAQQDNIVQRRNRVFRAKREFEAIAADIEDAHVKKLADEMAKFTDVVQNLYDHVEGLWIASFTTRKQLQILNDVLRLVPEIANNTAVMNAIEKAAIDFAQKYGNLKLTSDTS